MIWLNILITNTLAMSILLFSGGFISWALSAKPVPDQKIATHITCFFFGTVFWIATMILWGLIEQ